MPHNRVPEKGTRLVSAARTSGLLEELREARRTVAPGDLVTWDDIRACHLGLPPAGPTFLA